MISDSVTSIGDGAFAYCYSLVSVTIGNSVTSIDEYAFYCCYNLVEVINRSFLSIQKGSTSYGYVAYYAEKVEGCDIVSIRIYNGRANNSSYPTVTVGSRITLIADEIANHTFSHWVDKNGKTVATTASATITVTGQNVYRPVYTVDSGVDVGNNWINGSYDGKMAGWAGDGHTLTPTRVTSQIFAVEAGQTIIVTCPASVVTTKGTESTLMVAYTLLTPVAGSDTGDFYTDYTTTGTATWKKTYTNNTGSTVYIVFQLKPSDGNAGFSLSNEAMQNVTVTIK